MGSVRRPGTLNARVLMVWFSDLPVSFHMSRASASNLGAKDPGLDATSPCLTCYLDTLNMASSLHNNFCHLVTLKPSILLENITIFVIWRRIVLGFSMHSNICWGNFEVGLSWRWALSHVPSDRSTSSFNWRGIAIAEFSTSRFENIQGPWSTIVCLLRSFFVELFNAVKYMV